MILISSLTSGGAEKVSARLASYLVSSGVQVVFVTLRGAEYDFFQLPSGVKRCSLDSSSEHQGFGKVIANAVRVFRVRGCIKKERPDVVVGFMTTSAVLAILSSVFLPVRVVVSERNYPGLKKINHAWSFLRKYFYRFADVHVVQTREIASWLRSNVGARCVEIIPNAVQWPISSVQPVVEPDALVPLDKKVILAVGTKVEQKGFDLLVEVFPRLVNAEDWVLVIVGVEARMLPYVELLPRDIKDKILLVGRIGNVSDWFERAEIFVLSSRYEGFPNVLLEAMSSGCACIAFDCPTGPAELIEHNSNGLLVSPGDVSEMSRGLSVLMGDACLRERLGRSAVNVRSEYSEDKIYGRWLAVLEKIQIES